MASAASNAINTHEKVCAERWRSTMVTMKEIKSILAVAALGLIGAMGGLIAWLSDRLPQ